MAKEIYLNNLYKIGKVYWILRDTGTPKDKVLSTGFMRQTSAPWATGKGVQIRVKKYVFQIGLCTSFKDIAEEDGLLYAVQGRIMDIPPGEIGDW